MEIVETGPRSDRLLQRVAALAQRSELLFVVAVSSLALALSATLDYCLSHIGVPDDGRQELLQHGVVFLFLITIVIGPLGETLLLQHIPILFARKFRLPLSVQFAVGSVPFAVLHFDAGSGGVAAGISGGIAYSLAYLTFLPKGKAKAYWMTTAIHGLYNVVPSIMLIRGMA